MALANCASGPVAFNGVANPEDFEVLCPGVLTERERPFVERFNAENGAIEQRGPVDIQALISDRLPEGTPGIGPRIEVTEDWVRYNNAKYDPDNRLGLDRDYAVAAGFGDIVAYPTFGAHDDTFNAPYPPSVRDTLLVSDINHEVTSYEPISPGDTLFLVINSRRVIDVTPTECSIYRSLAMVTTGSVYNQRGQRVNDVTFRLMESIKIYREGRAPPGEPTFQRIWEAPNWMDRPAHVYTDADWQRIRTIWGNERRQGATPRFWEDVRVGERPAATLDGPIDVSVSPIRPWGMGAGGSRTLRREIMNPDTFSTMVRDERDGAYRLPNREGNVPPMPAGGQMPGPPSGGGAGAIETTEIHEERDTRSILINYMGRDFAIRHINNWMGDQGRLRNIRWGIMDARTHAQWGKTVPAHPEAQHFLQQVPSLRGRHVETHGMTGDVAIVQSYVTNAYQRQGEHLVDLVWWIETINGDIWEEGQATIALPTRAGG